MVPELNPQLTQDIYATFRQNSNPPHYHDIFHSTYPTLLWLPDNAKDSYNMQRHILRLLNHTHHAFIRCLATRTAHNETSNMLTTHDFLDEWNPLWWRNPPKELINITPINPNIRVAFKPKGQTRSRDEARRAFILTYANAPATGAHTFPDIENSWSWQTVVGDGHEPSLGSFFQLDVSVEHQETLTQHLQQDDHPVLGLCAWRVCRHGKRPGLPHRSLIWGFPKQSMPTRLERQVYVRQLQQTLYTTPDLLVGDLLMRHRPDAIYADTNDADIWTTIPRTYVDSILVISKHQAIIHTSRSQQEWTALMTTQEEAEAESKITKLRWKTSTLGGGLWATPNTITANRHDWFKGHDDRSITTTGAHIIHIQTTQQDASSVSDITGKLTSVLRAASTPPPPPTPQEPPDITATFYTLQPTYDKQNTWTGGFIYRVRSEREGQQLHQLLHNSCMLRRTAAPTGHPSYTGHRPICTPSDNGDDKKTAGRGGTAAPSPPSNKPPPGTLPGYTDLHTCHGTPPRTRHPPIHTTTHHGTPNTPSPIPTR